MTRSSVARRLRPLAAAALATVSARAAAVSCSVATQPVSFGVYDPSTVVPLTTTGSVDVACTCNVIDCVAFGYRIDISAGRSGSTAARAMGNGTDRLQYNLYSDPAFTGVWGGSGNGLGMLYLVALFGTRQSVTVYGRMPAGQSVSAGTYIDTPAVTVFY